VGNAGWPTMTSGTIAAITTTRTGTTDSLGMGERPTWPKLRRMGSLHCSWPTPAQCYNPEEKRARVKLELPFTPTPCRRSPRRPCSTSMSYVCEPSSVTALTMTSLSDGTLTVVQCTT
jgi:hypothetical protein